MALYLRVKGHEAEHVLDLDLGRMTSDAKIWEYAADHGQIVVTKDSDFVELALLHSRSVPVVLVCLGNCRNTALLEAFGRRLDSICQRLSSGETLVELW